MNCSVTFFPTHCVFQDLQTGKKIGGGSKRSGLDYLDTHVSPSVALWLTVDPYQLHCCIDQPLLQNLKKLVPSGQSFQSLPCEICEFS